MAWDFKGRVALVTAAAGQGCGQAIARRLAADHATVIVTDSHERRTREVSEAMAAEYDTTVVGYPMDVGDRRRCDEVIAEVTGKFGPIQILVNNAGLNIHAGILEYDADNFDLCLNVNLTACWYLAKGVVPGMKESGGGSIVNISSVATQGGAAAIEAPYAAGKAGLHAITRGLARAAGPFNIRCNEVSMHVVADTRYLEVHHKVVLDTFIELAPLGRLCRPADIANAVAFLCSDEASYISGHTLIVDGAISMGGEGGREPKSKSQVVRDLAPVLLSAGVERKDVVRELAKGLGWAEDFVERALEARPGEALRWVPDYEVE